MSEKPTLGFAEYIWIDGTEPVQKLRSKSKVVEVKEGKWEEKLPVIKEWNFDGSSTNQAEGGDSERILKPVRTVTDPLRDDSYLVLCEVMNPDGTPHESNMRAKLRSALEQGGEELGTLWGFEQEYCLMDNYTDEIMGWPDNSKFYPKPQGEFYCGVGCDEVVGRDVIHAHAKACVDAGLLFYGHNAEVMLGQWEFQIGHRGFKEDPMACPLTTSDHLWLARYLLYRIGEQHRVYATLTPKPKKGDWNGSGMHTNFSDNLTRNPETGRARIESIRAGMGNHHMPHQEAYGHGNRDRLTGLHETAKYEEFSMGQADRGASIRIPNQTEADGCGYIEDRRPAANADPYVVTERILNTLVNYCEFK